MFEILGALWLVLGVVSWVVEAGYCFAYFQRCYPTLATQHYGIDTDFAWVSGAACMALPILINVIMFYIVHERGRYGWKLPPSPWGARRQVRRDEMTRVLSEGL